MRLGQLARKYDISTQEINSYIKKIDPSYPTLHPNSKLDERIEKLVTEYYDDFLGVVEEKPLELDEIKVDEVMDEVTESAQDLDEPANLAEAPQNSSELPDMDVKAPESGEIKKETIETDRLLELLESEDEEVDLSSITHIKVPKKELSGLKVLGKIEIQEPKKKVEEIGTENAEGSTEDQRKKRHEARRISEEEREKRRLRAKRKKEEYEARELKRKQEQEERKIKDLRKARYEQRLGQAASSKKKSKTSVKTEIVTSEVYHPQPKQPKTIFGRLWKWLNSY